jgi:hypothetical protein
VLLEGQLVQVTRRAEVASEQAFFRLGALASSQGHSNDHEEKHFESFYYG